MIDTHNRDGNIRRRSIYCIFLRLRKLNRFAFWFQMQLSVCEKLVRFEDSIDRDLQRMEIFADSFNAGINLRISFAINSQLRGESG